MPALQHTHSQKRTGIHRGIRFKEKIKKDKTGSGILLQGSARSLLYLSSLLFLPLLFSFAHQHVFVGLCSFLLWGPFVRICKIPLSWKHGLQACDWLGGLFLVIFSHCWRTASNKLSYAGRNFPIFSLVLINQYNSQDLVPIIVSFLTIPYYLEKSYLCGADTFPTSTYP